MRIDGILHCRECLAAAERRLSARSQRFAPRVGTALLGLLVLAPALLVALVAMHSFGLVAGRLSRFGAVAFEKVAGAVASPDEAR